MTLTELLTEIDNELYNRNRDVKDPNKIQMLLVRYNVECQYCKLYQTGHCKCVDFPDHFEPTKEWYKSISSYVIYDPDRGFFCDGNTWIESPIYANQYPDRKTANQTVKFLFQKPGRICVKRVVCDKESCNIHAI